MLINEVIEVDEAISVTQYQDGIRAAIISGLQHGFSQVAKMQGKYPKYEQKLLSDSTRDFRLSIRPAILRSASANISKQVAKFINSKIPSKPLNSIKFGKTGTGVGGYARDLDVVVTRDYLVKLVNIALENTFDAMYKDYDDESLIPGFYFICKAFASGDPEITTRVLEYAESIVIGPIVSVIVHELVHVVQHKAQFEKGKDRTDYRSYLEKKKGDFYKLTTTGSPAQRSTPQYTDMYYASPQEVAAFSHEIAIKIIKSHGYDTLKKGDEIPRIDPNKLILEINNRLGNRFHVPRNDKEKLVYRRYIKLVYQEVQRYIEHKTK